MIWLPAGCWNTAQPPSFNKASQRPAFFDIRESETWATLIYTSSLRVSTMTLIFINILIFAMIAFRIETHNLKGFSRNKKTWMWNKHVKGQTKKNVTSPNFQSSPLEPWKPMGETYLPTYRRNWRPSWNRRPTQVRLEAPGWWSLVFGSPDQIKKKQKLW